MRRDLALAIASLLLVACGKGSSDPAQSDDEIRGGRTESGLTAAHCGADVSTPDAICGRFLRMASGRTYQDGALLSDATLRERCLADTNACTPMNATWVKCVEARLVSRQDTELCRARSGCGG